MLRLRTESPWGGSGLIGTQICRLPQRVNESEAVIKVKAGSVRWMRQV